MFPPVAVLLVADDPLVRAGLTALLADGASVVRSAGTDAVAEQLAGSGADIVVWDADDGVPAPTDLDLGVPVVLLVRREEDPARIGAAAILRRDVDPDRLAAALAAVRAGLRVVDDRFPAPVRPAARLEDGPREPLTARELEVLGLLAEGRSNREIAIALDISVHTAKFHVDRILLKLEASSRTDAVVRAVRLGLLTL